MTETLVQPKRRGRPKGSGRHKDSGRSAKVGTAKGKPRVKPAVPYHRKPFELSLEAWQMALRRQFAESHPFGIEKLGKEPVFTDYRVTNPENRNSYKVSIRDNEHSFHFCSCYDFKTNGLGTCKHLEAVVHRIRKNRKLNQLYLQKYRPDYSSVYLSYLDGRTVKVRIGTVKEEEFRTLAGIYFNDAGELKPEMIGQFEKFLKQAARIHPSFRCYPDALEFILGLRDAAARMALIGERYQPYLNNGKFDGLLQTRLFRYQKEGVCFAVTAGRSLIADDMGLGKTIQALAVAELMRKERGIATVLIVCPTSLKYQWKTEIEKFTGSSVQVIEGMALQRNKQYTEDHFYKIISYHALCNDLKEVTALAPDLVILDEAQRIKNFKTKVAQTVKKVHSPYALVLTGTPLENKLEELYSIMQYVNPFKLGPFFRFLDSHQVKDEKGKVTGYRNLNEIGTLLSDVMIRRRRNEVLHQLPARMDKILFVPMTAEQRRVHDECANIVARLVSKWRQFGYLSEQDRQRLLILLNQMRMACDSTFILDQESRHDTKVDEVIQIIEEVMSEGEEKLVIFSQWERMTRLVAQALDERGIGYEYLHGGVPGNQRGALYEGFSNDPGKRIFLSTDAGGVGLNLQAGSIVINLDIPWNPAVLEQRVGRIHRLGQKRNVTVINMVAAGTIEHRMLSVLKFKSSMAAGILDGGEDAIFMGESRFKKFMQTVDELVVHTGGAAGTASAETLVDSAETLVDSADTETPPAPVSETGVEDADPQEKASRDMDLTGNETPESAFPDPPALLKSGLDFLSGLSVALSSPDTARQLVDSIVSEDPSDGKTYLKIPVESRQVVENIFGLIGSMMKGMGNQ
ncbi:MAG: DEAD/DEAH box helicase [Bacteroidales bacterium]|nr:DEAD/DEAH box helicase [Bacteroidales bacterium]